jgi:NTE family protein
MEGRAGAAAGRRPGPRVAVVIGAVGIRGLAAIPLFEFLDEAAIEVDLIVATGGGALAAAMRGAGLSTSSMRDVAAQLAADNPFTVIDYRTLLGLAHARLARPGIAFALKRADRAQALYRRIFGDRRLEDCRPPTLLQAADCVRGGSVVLDRGLVADAVYAAGALAPEFPPHRIDGRWLVDGSFVSPVPVLEAIKRQADVIVALFHDDVPKVRPTDLLEANYNILAACFSRLSRDQLLMAVDLHHHEIQLLPFRLDPHVGPWEVAGVGRVLEAGREVVARHADEMLAVIRGHADAV